MGIEGAPFPEADFPKPFGYKTAWLAIKTHDSKGVAAVLGMREPKPANWQMGIEEAYDKSIFISPALGAWTLAVGAPLCRLGHSVDKIKPLLELLSSQFGEAQFFCTHRVVEMHVWARAAHGRIVRGYGWIGERGETVWNEGDQTEEERKLGFRFFDERSESFPNEGCVMRLAASWSIDPTTLDEQFKERGLGLMGVLESDVI
jgi:hypothetical protein